MDANKPNEHQRLFSAPLLLGVLLLVCAAIYVLSSGDYFVFDSKVAIEDNYGIAIDGRNLDEWRIAAQSSSSGPLGRPISMLSFALNHVLAPDSLAYWVRITNIAIHCLIGWLIYLVFYRLLRIAPILEWDEERARQVAVLAAALWLMHPLHVSTVLYGVQRMAQLPALFTLLGVWCYLRIRWAWIKSAPSARDYSHALLLVVIATALAGFSKENGLLLPWLLAVMEALFFRYRTASGESTLLKAAVILGFLAPVVLVLGRLLLQPDWLANWYAFRDFSVGERLLTEARILWFYVGQLVLPDIRSMGLHHDDIRLSVSLFQPLSTLSAVAAWIGVALLAWGWRRRYPLFAFAVFWFLVAHAMESSLVPLLLTFEHRNYLPSFGLFLFFASLLWSASSAWASYRLPVAFLVVTGLALLLLMRALPWQTELGLAEVQYQRKPASLGTTFHLATAYYNAANAMIGNEDEQAKAQEYYAASDILHQRVLDLDPEYIPSLVALVYIRTHSSDPQEVENFVRRIRQALATPHLTPSGVHYLQVLTDCVSVGECRLPVEEYLAILEGLIAQHPEQFALQDMRIRLCLLAERWDCADEAIAEALSNRPDSSVARRALLTRLLQQQRVAQALDEVRGLMLLDDKRRNMRAVRTFLGGQQE